MNSSVRQVFLDENRYINAQSAEHNIDVDLTRQIGLLPDSNIQKDFSLYEQYNKERDECTKLRLILTVNPICSNVLFNMKTEVAKANKGKFSRILENSSLKIDNAINTTNVNQRQAVRDTEYSSSAVGSYNYYCGMDIFNNHLLRATDFIHVNLLSDNADSESKKVFNTINDFRRDSDGNTVLQNINNKFDTTAKTKMHLYQYDTIDTFRNGYSDNLAEQNGWYGFYNRSTVTIPNTSNGDSFNKILSNRSTCEFIDLYPGRDLYTFIPTYNAYFNRLEYNWDTFLTYAYSSDTETVDLINEGKDGAIRCFFKESHDSNGREIYLIRTLVPHTLAYNDKVRFYVGEKANTKLSFTVRVISVGDIEGKNTQWYFSVSKDALSGYTDKMEQALFYKKVVNGVECKYYFKLLKALKSYKYEKIADNSGKEYSVMPKAYKDAPTKIKVNNQGYELNISNPRFEINKAAFAENIYGDNIAQVIYKDDIELDGLKDNLGRQISTIYFTAQKSNKGYEKWYNSNSEDIDAEEIEQSHAFGKLTAGIDMGHLDSIDGFSGVGEFNIMHYNSNYIHNVTLGANGTDLNTRDCWGDIVIYSLKSLEVQQYYLNDSSDEGKFYGDLIEFSPSEFEETIIAPMMYRFNTAQREIISDNYTDIWYDEIETDDYDVQVNEGSKPKFKTNELTLNTIKDSEEKVYGNIAPEGYMYRANLPIMVGDPDEDLTSVNGIIINYDSDNFSLRNGDTVSGIGGGQTLTFTPPTDDYEFIKEDIVAIYDAETTQIKWGVVSLVKEDVVYVYVEDGGLNYSSLSPNSRTSYVIASNESVPTYAMYIPSSGKFVWRSITKPSELPRDSELYDQTFANGCFYFEPVLNFFVRRQDPHNDSGLSKPKGGILNHPMSTYYIRGRGKLDLSAYDYVLSTLNRPCY